MPDTRRTNKVLVVDDAPENIDLLDNVLNQDYKIKAALDKPSSAMASAYTLGQSWLVLSGQRNVRSIALSVIQ